MPFSNVSHNEADAQAFRNHTEQFSNELLSRGFFSSRVRDRFTRHLGVTGKLILTELEIGTLGSRYTEDFAPRANTIKFKPRILNVTGAKFEHRFVPQRYRQTYLGDMQARAFNGLESIPFEAFVMNKIADKQAREIGFSIWQAVESTTPAAADNLLQIHDGFLSLVTKALAAPSPKITAVPVPGGAWTKANIEPTLRQMWMTLDDDVREMPVDVSMPVHLWMLYQEAYRDIYNKHVQVEADKRIKLDFGLDVSLVPVTEMGRTTNRVIMTPSSNFHEGFDAAVTDGTGFMFERDKRALDYWFDFQMGVQFGILETGIVAVNDLA